MTNLSITSKANAVSREEVIDDGITSLKDKTHASGVTVDSYNNSAMEGSGKTFKLVESEDGTLTVDADSLAGWPDNSPDNFAVNPISQTITYSDKDGNELVLNYSDNVKKGETVHLNVVSQGGMTVQVGGMEGHEISIKIPDISLDTMGISEIDLSTEEAAKESMEMLDAALAYVSKVNSQLGAFQNRFEATLSNLNVTEENLTESFSTIRDTDMASEMVEYTKLQILTQAGTSMLTQSNEMPQQALQLLQ